MISSFLKRTMPLIVSTLVLSSSVYAVDLPVPDSPPYVAGLEEVPSPAVGCDYGQYISVLDGNCTDINPVTKSVLGSNVWMELGVNKTTKNLTGEIISCNEFRFNELGDLNVTHYFKNENDEIITVSSSYASYDDSQGYLSMGFGQGGDYSDESGFLSAENPYVFLVNYSEYGDGYEVKGVVEQNTTATCSQIASLPNFVYMNDYYNDNTEKNIQLSGHIYLPEDINPNEFWIQAVDGTWNNLSYSDLDKQNDNLFVLGFDQQKNASIVASFSVINEDGYYDYQEYVYTIENGWIEKDDMTPISSYMINVDSNMSNLDLNISNVFASQVKFKGNIIFDAGESVDVEFINIQNGNYFGWNQIGNSGDTFSAKIPSKNIGDKYLVKVNKYSDMNWESYYVSINEDGSLKYVSDQNVEYKDVNGLWLPDFEKVGYIELKDTTGDSQITQEDISDINITLTSDVLDSQSYIIEGNITVPSSFILTSTTDSWNNGISFDVTDAQTGEWITWAESEKIDLDSSSDTNTYAYKIKITPPVSEDLSKEVLVKVYYDGSTYFIDQDGNLTSETKIEYTPIFIDIMGNVIPELSKTEDECMQNGNYWYYEGSKCYNESPKIWIPNPEQSGKISFNVENKKVTVDLDFNALDNNSYKLSGEITVPADFTPSYDWQDRAMIRIEAINAETGMWVGSKEISDSPVEGKPNTYKYMLTLQDVDENSSIAVRLIKEQNIGGEWTWESYYLDFNDNNVSDVSFVAEESVLWGESEKENEYGYHYWVPIVDSFSFGTEKTVGINIDFASEESAFEDNRMAIEGKIKLESPVVLGMTSSYMWNNIRVEVINTYTGDWINSKDAKCVDSTNCDELTFDIDIPSEGNYSVKIIKEIDGIWQEYFYNFGVDHDVNATDGVDGSADKLINGQNVEWVEAKGLPSWGGTYKNWLANPEKTGFVTITSGKKSLLVDFANFTSNRLFLAGTVQLNYDFTPGEYCTNTAGAVKICEWYNPDNRGYNIWNSSKYARVEVISKNNGSFVGSTELKSVENSNTYEFKLDLGEKDSENNSFIVKITQEESSQNDWKYTEIYYNFGSDHEYLGTVTDTLVNGKKVMWTEASEAKDGYKNWMPNPEETGYVNLTNSLTDFYADVSEFGESDKKLKGKIVFKSDFDISSSKSYADISAIDAATGMWIGNSAISDDGSFEINVGENGHYILQINYSYNDYNNWENSWWKNRYYDFGSDHVYGGTGDGEDKILNDMDVRWVPVLGTKLSYTTDTACYRANKFWYYEGDTTTKGCYDYPQNWVPNVKYLDVTDNVNGLDIDLSKSSGKTLNISISNLPSNAKDPYVYVVDPLSYGGIWQELKDGNASIVELREGNYTVEFGYSVDGSWEYKHYFIKDDSTPGLESVDAVPGNEVQWKEIDSATHMWGPDPKDTTYAYISADTNMTITIPTIQEYKVDISLGSLSTNSEVSVDFRSLDKPYGRWESLSSGSDTNVSASFSDVKKGKYILSFWYDGNEYTVNTEANGSRTLKKDVEWVAKDSDDYVVCGGDVGWDNCDYTAELSWQPNVNALVIDGNDTIVLNIAPSPKITGSINLDSEYAGKEVYVSVYNNSDWNWKQFTLDSNGDVNGSIRVDGGDDYRVEVWIDGLGGYVFDNNGTPNTTSDDSWITQMKSWDQTTWMPKTTTLIDVRDDLSLGTITVGDYYQKVTVTVENLDSENGNIVEDVWVSLEGVNDEGYYGEGNANWDVYPVAYDENITLKVPSGDYRIMVFPMNHKGGYASNGDSTNNQPVTSFTKIGWSEYDKVEVNGTAVNVTVTLPLATAVGNIAGTVTCGLTSGCAGWIDAWNSNGGKGAMVDTNGSYKIKGLDDGNYSVSYSSYDGTISLNSENVVVTPNATTPLNLEKTADNVYSVSGNISGPVGTYAALIKTNGSTYEVVATRQLDDSYNFSFGEVAKPATGKAYYVVGAVLVKGPTDYTVTYKDPKAVDPTRLVNMPDLGDKAYSGSEDINVTLNDVTLN
jgi:hypothetical protein